MCHSRESLPPGGSRSSPRLQPRPTQAGSGDVMKADYAIASHFSRLCRLMCGRSVTFRQTVNSDVPEFEPGPRRNDSQAAKPFLRICQASSFSPLRRSWLSRLLVLLGPASKITQRFCFKNKLRGDRPRILAAVKTDSGPGAFEQHRHGHHGSIERREAQVPCVAPELICEDSLFVLADDLALKVALDYQLLFWHTGFGVDNRNCFLRGSGLAAAA